MAKAHSISQAVAALQQGHAVVFPTETVYGLGVAVCAAKSPRVLYDIKQRPDNKPIAWLVGAPSDVKRYGADVPAYALELAHTYWPGPLTLIVKANSAVPPAFCSESGTIGLRMPANDTALALINALGCPLATTSANVAGRPAVATFANIDAAIATRAAALVCDDAQKSGVASTVVDVSGSQARIVRQGALGAEIASRIKRACAQP